MKTLQEQYNLIKEGKGNKQQFFKSARHLFPDLVTPVNSFNDAVNILKNRGVISEMFVGGGVVTKGRTPDWFSIFNENMNSIDYGSWKKELMNIIKKDANLDDNEISVDEEEIKRYYKEGKSPNEVYNNIWLKDAGNFRSLNELSGKFGSKEEVIVINNKTKKEAKATIQSTEMSKDQPITYSLKYTGEKPQGFPSTLTDDDLTDGDEGFSLKRPKLNEAKEAKAIEKETTKEVTDMATRGYDYKDTKNIDNIFGTAFLKGFYSEMQDPKNEGKTVEELKQIVAKNMAKDCLHYVKNSPFGVEGGYTVEAPGLGEPKPAKGKHKSSGYGDLKESVLRSQIYLLVKEVLAESKISEKDFNKALKMVNAGKSIKSVAEKLKIDQKQLETQIKNYKEDQENLETSDKG